MAAEGCEEISGNGEFEDSSGSFISVHAVKICNYVVTMCIVSSFYFQAL